MTDDAISAFKVYFRYERAVEAARRFLRESTTPSISVADARAFLRRRRELLPDDEIERAAADAMDRWVHRSRGMQFRG
jgi:hypothetical protein